MIRRNYLKSLMIFILTCLPLLGVSAQQKVTVNVVNASLKQVFSTIENQTSYRFSYKSDIIDHRKDITIRKSGVPVTAVLDAALKGRNLKYSVVSQILSLFLRSMQRLPLLSRTTSARCRV